MILTGSKSAAVDEVYVGQAQIPTLRPGQVVVVNSLLPHKGERRVHELLVRWGCNVLYLLPDSLHLNPVEEAFLKVKGALRRAGARNLKALVGAMNWALDAVAARDARAFFEHCGNRLWSHPYDKRFIRFTARRMLLVRAGRLHRLSPHSFHIFAVSLAKSSKLRGACPVRSIWHSMSAGVACGCRPFSRNVPRKRLAISDKGRDKGIADPL